MAYASELGLFHSISSISEQNTFIQHGCTVVLSPPPCLNMHASATNQMLHAFALRGLWPSGSTLSSGSAEP